MSDTDAEVIVRTAYSAAEGVVLTTDPSVFIVPAGYDLVEVDPEQYQETPRRQRGTTVLYTPDAFTDFIQGSGPAVIYADVLGCRRVTAVFNGGSADEPGWGDHRADLELVSTEAWKRWTGRSGKLTSQQEFAEFIEDNLRDIIDPPGAVMLDMAQRFEATVKVEFTEDRRLESGQRQFVYKETIGAKAGQAGTLMVPESFTLLLAPFEGTEPVEMRARLRYRLTGQALTIGFVLDRPDIIQREAFDLVLGFIQSQTNTVPLAGTPRA